MHVREARQAAFDVGPMQRAEIPAVAELHCEMFGHGEDHGSSLAGLGPAFLAEVFYELNVDNPHFFVDVARWEGAIVGFCVYASDWRLVSRHVTRRHPFRLAWRCLRFAVRQPFRVVRHLAANARFAAEGVPVAVRPIAAWHMLIGVKPEHRSRAFRERTGFWVGGELWELMIRTLRSKGRDQLWAAVAADKPGINQLYTSQGAELLGQTRLQGIACNLFRKPFDPAGVRR
jgi:hypothetical protein